MASRNHHPALKTMGARAASLVTALAERQQRVVSLENIRALTGMSQHSVRQFADQLVRRGLLTRLRPGLFTAVPFDLGREHQYLGNPYVVARELIGKSRYYISHASAMEIHQMTTQPQLVVYATSPKRVRARRILGTEFRFVRCRPQDLFGVVNHWIEPTEQVAVSDLERTVIDGLRQPRYCGGLTEVAKGFWMRRKDIDVDTLIAYAIDLGNGAVIRRLGFVLDAFGVPTGTRMDRLRLRVRGHYVLADPTLPAEGRYLARWRIRLNVTPEELRAAAAA